MGLAHISNAEYEAKEAGDTLCFDQFPVVGLLKTSSANKKVTCSAAAGTALATGYKTNQGIIGLSPDYQIRYKKITYDLKKMGYQIGIATSVSVDHATPAAFYAYEKSRTNYYEIGLQTASSKFEFFAGSGFVNPTPAGKTSTFDLLKENGYQISHTPQNCLDSKSKYNILIQAPEKNQEYLPYPKQRKKDDLTLEQLTSVGIQKLANGRPFFFMVEAGTIDWASHYNKLTETTQEVQQLSQSIELALAFYEKHPDETLIIVTADHETGGMIISENKTKFNSKVHTGVAVPVFAMGEGSEIFAGYYENSELIKKLRSLVIFPQFNH